MRERGPVMRSVLSLLTCLLSSATCTVYDHSLFLLSCTHSFSLLPNVQSANENDEVFAESEASSKDASSAMDELD